MKTFRLIHLYLGLFFAPAILFFAFTGAMQTFSLHETTKGSDYRPPQWLVTLAQIHKSKRPVGSPKAKPSTTSADAPPSSAAPAYSASVKEKSPESSAAEKPQPEMPKADSAPQSQAASTPFRPHVTTALKLFFLCVSISLFVSTATGIYMAFKYRRDRRIVWALLVLGVIIPVSFTLF